MKPENTGKYPAREFFPLQFFINSKKLNPHCMTVIAVFILIRNNKSAPRQICNYFGRNGKHDVDNFHRGTDHARSSLLFTQTPSDTTLSATDPRLRQSNLAVARHAVPPQPDSKPSLHHAYIQQYVHLLAVCCCVSEKPHKDWISHPTWQIFLHQRHRMRGLTFPSATAEMAPP